MQGGDFGDFGGVEVRGDTLHRDNGLKDINECLRERAKSKSHLSEDAQLGRKSLWAIEKTEVLSKMRTEVKAMAGVSGLPRTTA